MLALVILLGDAYDFSRAGSVRVWKPSWDRIQEAIN